MLQLKSLNQLYYMQHINMNRRSSTTISTKPKASFKVVMIGERGVGKTSILMRYSKGTFCKTSAVTIGIESFNKEFVIDSEKYGLQIWDTVGQDGFKSIVKSFYSQACAVIIVYSDPQQLKRTINAYLKDIQQSASQHVIVGVIRAKIDVKPMINQERTLLQEYHCQEKITLWMEVSAKEGVNVENFFQKMGGILAEKYEDDRCFKRLVSPDKTGSIFISKAELGEIKMYRKKSCCGP